LRGCGIIAGYGLGVYQDIVSIAKNIKAEMRKEKFFPDDKNHKIYSAYSEIYQNIFFNSLQKTFHLLSEQKV